MKKAVIFDFNGTLFFDTEKHALAWRQCASELLGRPITDSEMDNILGRNNARIMEHLLGRTPTEDEHTLVETIGRKKESIYRDLCRADADNCRLAPGAELMLDRLKKDGVPIAIATSSDIDNVNFYYEMFDIGRWFGLERVIYDDGTINGKPAPDIYLRAAERLGFPPSDCIVFEDAISGIAAARNAGVEKIYAVASGTSPELLAAQPSVHAVIYDYTEFTDTAELLR